MPRRGQASRVPSEFDKNELVRAHNAMCATTSQLFGHMSILTVAASPIPTLPSDLAGLTMIKIKDMTEERVHRGQILMGMLCVDAFRLSAIVTILEDRAGYAVRVSIYNDDSGNFRQKYAKGMKVAIRSPYLRRAADGKLAVRIDDPDTILQAGHADDFQSVSLSTIDKVTSLKAKGNRHFEDGDLRGALQAYTECISTADSSEQQPDAAVKKVLLAVLSNRAEVYLKMKHYEHALVDTNRALKLDNVHVKSLCRKARALHECQEYEQAIEHLKKAKEVVPDNAGIVEYLERSRLIDQQSKTGKYRLFCKDSECCDFVGPVVIKTGGRHGRGLFTTKPVKAGDLLLVSRPIDLLLVDPNKPDKSDFKSELSKKVVEQLKISHRAQAQFRTLVATGEAVPDMRVFKANSRSVSDQLEYLEVPAINEEVVKKVVDKYAYDTTLPMMVSSTGLWVLPCFINHSCLPNASMVEAQSALFVHAAKTLKAGEEILICYVDSLTTFSSRKARLKSLWGFKCYCERCVLEKSIAEKFLKFNSTFYRVFSVAAVKCTMMNNERRIEEVPECLKLILKLEKLIESIENLSEEQKQWLRASYSTIYMMKLFMMSKNVMENGIKEIMDIMHGTAPGHLRTLMLMVSAGIVDPHSEMFKELCLPIYGRLPVPMLERFAINLSMDCPPPDVFLAQMIEIM